eukprot:351140-Chlamydomonas_euryale.AAC.12
MATYLQSGVQQASVIRRWQGGGQVGCRACSRFVPKLQMNARSAGTASTHVLQIVPGVAKSTLSCWRAGRVFAAISSPPVGWSSRCACARRVTVVPEHQSEKNVPIQAASCSSVVLAKRTFGQHTPSEPGSGREPGNMPMAGVPTPRVHGIQHCRFAHVGGLAQRAKHFDWLQTVRQKALHACVRQCDRVTSLLQPRAGSI